MAEETTLVDHPGVIMNVGQQEVEFHLEARLFPFDKPIEENEIFFKCPAVQM